MIEEVAPASAAAPAPASASAPTPTPAAPATSLDKEEGTWKETDGNLPHLLQKMLSAGVPRTTIDGMVANMMFIQAETLLLHRKPVEALQKFKRSGELGLQAGNYKAALLLLNGHDWEDLDAISTNSTESQRLLQEGVDQKYPLSLFLMAQFVTPPVSFPCFC